MIPTWISSQRGPTGPSFSLSSTSFTPAWEPETVGFFVPSGVDADDVYFEIADQPSGFAVVEG